MEKPPLPAPQSPALAEYLREIERGLGGLPSGRRRLVLRELESHLLDEAEARGLQEEGGLRSLLSEKEAPELLAREIAEGEDGDASHRSESALLAGALLGIATGGTLWLQWNWPWYFSLLYGIVQGLAVGTGVFLLRPRWQQVGPRFRLAFSILFGLLLALPLGFTSRRGFEFSRLIYGAFTGYLVERHSTPRPLWQTLLENLALLALDFAVVKILLGSSRPYDWSRELAFNLILTLAILGALALRRSLSGRWLLAAGER